MFLKSVALLSAFAITLGSAQAAFIYGLSTGLDKGIFKINTATGASRLVHEITHGGATNNNDVNAFAYDGTAGNFFYNAGGKLYKVNASGESLVGTLAKSAASGTFYNGSYYYVENNSKNVRKVNVGTFSDTLFSTPTGLVNAGYGDIASSATGAFYGATGTGFYEGSLANASSGVSYKATNPGSLQLGFYGSTLYGINTSTDRIYALNTATGAATLTATLTNASRLYITDAASAEAVPEPASLAALGLG
ncbi:hypothetical protein EON81_22760, partial [bacterium]